MDLSPKNEQKIKFRSQSYLMELRMPTKMFFDIEQYCATRVPDAETITTCTLLVKQNSNGGPLRGHSLRPSG